VVQPLLCGMQPTKLIPGYKLVSMLGSFVTASIPQAPSPASLGLPDFCFPPEDATAPSLSSQQAATESGTVTHLRKASSSVSQRPARHLAPGWRADCLSSCGVLSGRGSRSHKTHLNPLDGSRVGDAKEETTSSQSAPAQQQTLRCLVVDSGRPPPSPTLGGSMHPPLAGIDLERRTKAARLATTTSPRSQR
jgi:hypothetical protein